MNKIGLVLTSLVLAAACGVTTEDDSTDSAEQALLGPNCVIRRPYAWHANSGGVGRTCFEGGPERTITLPPGGEKTFIANSPLSHGEDTVVCHANGDGRWDDTFTFCFPGGGGEL